MTSETLGRVEDASENPPQPAPYTIEAVELSPSLRAELLDLEAWGEILATYGRTMGVAVALTDAQGRLLGETHNAQPVWKLMHDTARSWADVCPFCVTSELPCTAVAEALLQVALGESGEEQFDKIAARIEQLIQAHLLDKESLK